MRAVPRILLRALPLLLALAGLLGCATSPHGVGSIRIGAVGPLSGEAAFFGNSTRNAYELAIAEWNEAGGVLGRRLELVNADDGGDPARGAAAYDRLIKVDRVVGIVGAVMSKVSLAGAPIAQAAGIPMISPTSTNPKVTEVGDFIFRACFIDPYQGKLGARFAYRDLGIRRAAAFFSEGNDYAKGLAETFLREFVRLGGEIVASYSHPSGETDLNAELSMILRSKPQLLYLPDYYDEVAAIAKQARELGFKGRFLGGDGWDSPELITRGGEAVEGAFFTNHYSADDPRPEVQSFVAKYRERFGGSPDALAALGYDSMQLMLEAIKRAGSSEGRAIRDALALGSFEGVTGRISFDADRNPVKSGIIIEIKGGQQVFRSIVHP